MARGRLIALVAGVAVLAAVIGWALSTYAVGAGARADRPSSRSATAAVHQSTLRVSSGDRAAVIMSITPAALAAGALGGYALPSTRSRPTTKQILASMDPATRGW